MSHVFLVGFMGAGKSTVARMVAKELGRPCIDVDELIEAHTGHKVAEIFALRGEQGFRDLESATLLSLEERPSSIVACGGGIVVRPENRAALHRLGKVVYLQVTTGEALARIGDAGSRPLLSGEGGAIAATALLQARDALYRSVADISIDTVGKDAEAVAGEVASSLSHEGLV
jgi:shikimate kinase